VVRQCREYTSRFCNCQRNVLIQYIGDGGQIDGTSTDLWGWDFTPPGIQGTIRVIQNGYGGAIGSGYLAEVHFHAFGSICETSFINFCGHRVLLDTEGNKIKATWQNATVNDPPPPEWTPIDSGTTAYLWGVRGTNSADVFVMGGELNKILFCVEEGCFRGLLKTKTRYVKNTPRLYRFAYCRFTSSLISSQVLSSQVLSCTYTF